jgi:hypothetical protein
VEEEHLLLHLRLALVEGDQQRLPEQPVVLLEEQEMAVETVVRQGTTDWQNLPRPASAAAGFEESQKP